MISSYFSIICSVLATYIVYLLLREKYADYSKLNKLNKEILLLRKKAKEAFQRFSLAREASKNSTKKQAEALKDYFKEQSYPYLKPPDYSEEQAKLRKEEQLAHEEFQKAISNLKNSLKHYKKLKKARKRLI